MDFIKHDVVHYWAMRSEAFEQQRMRELDSDKPDRWMEEINRYIPQGRKLKVLDVGTGTGFFAFLMDMQGHDVTGIDLTPEMIERAGNTAAILGRQVHFEVMDAENPRFEPESFDVLLTRNLTWTLPHADKAYKAWHKLLTPGGVLVNFDADYCRVAEEDMPLPEDHAHNMISDDLKAMNDSIMMELSAYQMPRPQWDIQLLAEAGFEQIHLDMGVYKRIYREIDEFYNPVPIFTIAAYKQAL